MVSLKIYKNIFYRYIFFEINNERNINLTRGQQFIDRKKLFNIYTCKANL